MSNIYIQEPPTCGKILLVTTVGDIDIELWSKETPKACRNFAQLCMEGYYNGTIFHRIVRGFIAQGGDPTGTGKGGESIYGSPFKDEMHTRLRFVRRGLVAMANAGKDDNGSQFFFTLSAAPELQNKHTIFGKVTGNTLYNMIKLADVLVDHDDRPLYPPKIIKTQVLMNPFNDIVCRTIQNEVDVRECDDNKIAKKANKNFKLLSFGDEAEEDEEAADVIAKEFRGKSKSSHDLSNDPKLSSIPAVADERKLTEEELSMEHSEMEIKQETLERIQKKLLKRKPETVSKPMISTVNVDDGVDDGVDDVEYGKDETVEKKKKFDEIRKEVNKLKKELSGRQKIQEQEDKLIHEPEENAAVSEYKNELRQFVEKKNELKALPNREAETLSMLMKFRNKLELAKDAIENISSSEKSTEKQLTAEGESDDEDTGWLTHTLQCEHQASVKDASIRDSDTFLIYDPRNPINQRRREASKKSQDKPQQKKQEL